MATLIVTSTPREGAEEQLNEYVQRVVKLFELAGARIVKRQRVVEVIAGEMTPKFVFVADFDCEKTIVDLFQGEAYRPLIALRDQAFEAIEILVAVDK